MRFILLLLILSALAFLSACQKASTTKLDTKSTPPANSDANQKTPDPADSAPRITLADAKKEFDEKTAVFIDTRDETAYKFEHIEGAINVSAINFEAKYKELPTDKKIIAYCS
jgi:predicted sulfurtransferase